MATELSCPGTILDALWSQFLKAATIRWQAYDIRKFAAGLNEAVE